jgi:nucleoside-diphosphate-sugar epimerase
MRVFVTGATGFVGSAVTRELLANGHQVLGLSRSDEGAAALREMGAEVQRGTLDDLDGLRAAAREADAVAHLAFNHDFSKFAENAEEDKAAILAMGEELVGTDKQILVTSGLAMIAPGRLAVESDGPAQGFPRQSEASATALAAKGVRASSVRLAPSTHGEGDHGFVPILIDIAREKGAAAYVGDGANRWPGVHRADAARLYRLALEQGVEKGPFHATDDEGVPFKQMAEVIGRRLGVPVISVAPDKAADHFGWFAQFAAADIPASSAHTRKILGWTPTEPGLLADLDQPYYFQG